MREILTFYETIKSDEPKWVRIAENADVVVLIHGYQGEDEVVFIGGKNKGLKGKIRYMLNEAGFHAEISTKTGLRAQHPENICNRCRSGEGVQESRPSAEALKSLSLSKKSAVCFYDDPLRKGE